MKKGIKPSGWSVRNTGRYIRKFGAPFSLVKNTQLYINGRYRIYSGPGKLVVCPGILD